ncbi:putative intracellular protease/amidase [Pseudoduganella lurida]|uniref:Putative intracellular protease/amidase n=1 Tax=Pseudoduganella lurida TaxID=1036180 RepID=A0A562R8L8_9BURK|nr:type 1 glutamine amidotransferase domain-containing protein [Pseudoduganella lurida]TWI65401.1 putative intracellular protease/amidase [Pseudoduganella lurida]
MSLKHVLFILTNAAEIGPNHRATGYFFPEVAHPVEVFDAAGIAIEYASPLGGTPPFDGYDENDPAQRAFRGSKAIRRMGRSRKLSEVDVLDYDAIFFPGGLGPMVDIALDPEVKRAVARAWDAGRIVAAVCHGPAAFLGVTLEDGTRLVQGRKLTSFSDEEEANYAQADVPFNLETALRAEGAEYSSVAPWQPGVVVDGRLLTGQNPASGGPLAQAIVAALQGEAA